MRSSLTARPTLAGALFLLVCFTPVAAEDDTRAAEATALYDEGRYIEALPLLRALVAEGDTRGATLYRLYYCQRNAGDPGAQVTLTKSVGTLEGEMADKPSLDTAFYLTNGYDALGRKEDALRIAQEATSRIESDKKKKKKDALYAFRVGTLYANQARADETAEWYRVAVDASEGDSSNLPASYRDWAVRFLAGRAVEQDKPEDIERYYSLMLAGGFGTGTDFYTLGIARLKVHKFREAWEAFSKVPALDMNLANEANYRSALCQRALEVEEIPASAPDGRPWTELTTEDLDGLLREQAIRAKEIRERADAARAERLLVMELRVELIAELDDARAKFVGAALRYSALGVSMREAAFSGGYAPALFQKTTWSIDRPRMIQRKKPGTS